MERAILQLLEIDPGYTYTAMSVILKLSRKTVSERIKKLKEKRDDRTSWNGYQGVLENIKMMSCQIKRKIILF